VGPPGSGKSSLISLIPRLHDPSSGCLLVDGRDLKEQDLTLLRDAVAFVPQDPFLFDGTIRTNLTLGRQVPEARIEKVLEQAALSVFIASLPAGLETVVGEKGVRLSGGQKQRIAFARALVKAAPLLVLDDPISQLDARTGRHLLQTITALPRQTTVIIVSHRMAAVENADRIIVLEGGEITAMDSPGRLATGNGYFARMSRLQRYETVAANDV
jgi:ATP-binding cassette subfamily B multidrug efflux pump